MRPPSPDEAVQFNNSAVLAYIFHCYRVNIWRIDEIVQELEDDENQSFGKSLEGVYYFSGFMTRLLNS